MVRRADLELIESALTNSKTPSSVPYRVRKDRIEGIAVFHERQNSSIL